MNAGGYGGAAGDAVGGSPAPWGHRHLVGWLEPDAQDAVQTPRRYRGRRRRLVRRPPCSSRSCSPIHRRAVPRSMAQAGRLLCRQGGLAPAASPFACPKALSVKSYPTIVGGPPGRTYPPLAGIYSGGARGRFPRPADRRRHALFLLHRGSTASGRRPERIDFVKPHDLPDRACGRRPLGDGDPRALGSVAASVRAICQGTAYRVGPSAIGMRRNAYGAAPAQICGGSRLAMAQADPRQRGLLAAAWAAGYAALMVAADVEALALNHLAGPSGVLGVEASEGRVRPVFHVMRALCGATGAACVDLAVEGEGVAALAWRRDGGTRILAANTTGRMMKPRWTSRCARKSSMWAASQAALPIPAGSTTPAREAARDAFNWTPTRSPFSRRAELHLRRVLPAVDGHRRAGDEARIVGHQEQTRRGRSPQPCPDGRPGSAATIFSSARWPAPPPPCRCRYSPARWR